MKKISICIILILTFIMQLFSITAHGAEMGADMEGHWAKEYGTRLMNLGIMNGYEDGSFKLQGNITRAEFVKLLVTFRYGDYTENTDVIYSDVSEDAWYFKYVTIAFENKILEEEEGDEFRPSDKITRGEMVYMIVQSLGLTGGSASFKDVSRSHKYYYQICGAVKSGIINGYEDNTFKPGGLATRGETAAMVCRILDYITEKELVDIPDYELIFLEQEDDESDDEDTEDEEVDFDDEIKGKINLTWHQIYSTGVTKTGNHMDGLNVISPTWFTLIDNTGLTPYSYEHSFYDGLDLYVADYGNDEYMENAREEGYKVWPMFNTEGNPAKTSRFLNNKNARAACVKLMRSFIKKYDLDGINLDFENMYQEDRDKYSEFVKEMADMCHDLGVVLSVDVTRYEPTSYTYSMCYDRTAIGEYADYVMLMGYDQNGTWSEEAGSVSDIPWTEESIELTLKEVPAEKLVLGIPFYARIWKTKDGVVENTSAVGMSTVAKRIEENDAEIIYDKKTGQNYAEWESEGYTYMVWIEDKTSIKARLELIEEYDLAGVASWSKTFETPDIWEFVEENLE